MIKFLEDKETTFLGKIKNIIFCFFIYIIWMKLIILFYSTLFASAQIDFGVYKYPTLVAFMLSCVFAPLWEEMVFRKIPMDIMVKLGRPDLLPSIIIFSSIIFGLVHNGVPSLLIQGVLGFVMAVLYVKNGYSYWSVVTLHALWNGYCLLNGN